MKIAFIVSAFPCLSETFILDQITGLIDLGHEVEIFAERDPGENITQDSVNKYHLSSEPVISPTGAVHAEMYFPVDTVGVLLVFPPSLPHIEIAFGLQALYEYVGAEFFRFCGSFF